VPAAPRNPNPRSPRTARLPRLSRKMNRRGVADRFRLLLRLQAAGAAGDCIIAPAASGNLAEQLEQGKAATWPREPVVRLPSVDRGGRT
jgi:hypothetical protein